MIKIEFYKKYIRLMGNLRDKPDMATPYKIEYLQSVIKDNKVYKFISLEGEPSLVRKKIDTLLDGNIWFSFYKTLNDETEYQINYKVKKVMQKTGRRADNINLLVNYLTQMYDVYSLTYEYNGYMWDDYASGGNGICIEFEVDDYDYLFPVEYIEKSKIDFTKMIISAINDKNLALSIIPWVIKNPYNQTANFDSTKEKEVRILYCPYDNGDLNSGVIQENIKEQLGYKGIAKPYEQFGLKISKVIIGNNCDGEMKHKIRSELDEKKIVCEERNNV